MRTTRSQPLSAPRDAADREGPRDAWGTGRRGPGAPGENAMNYRSGGIGIVGTVIIVLVILWLVGVL